MKRNHCEKCGKSFKKSQSLIYHLVTVHNEKLSENQLKSVENRIKKGKKLPIKEISPTCRKCQKSHFENTRDFDEHVLSCYDEISTKNNTCFEFKVEYV